MPLNRVTPPEIEPLSVAQVRESLKIGVDALDDATVKSLIKTARIQLENKYGVAMINQTWSLVLDRFPGCSGYQNSQERGFYPTSYYDSRSVSNDLRRIEIPIEMTPMAADAIKSVGYMDVDGMTQVLDPSVYKLVVGKLTSRLALTNQSSWPSTAYVAGAVDIRFVAGFGASATTVDDTLKSAMMLLIAHLRSLTAQNLFVSQENIPGVFERRFIVGTGSGDVIDAAVSSLMQEYERPSL